MTHADDKELTLLLRGGLSESEKAKVMEHIAECDECADRMACLTQIGRASCRERV